MSFRRAVAFLTPFGGAAAPTPATLAWFPVVGALFGLVLGAWWWLAARWWTALPAAALVVAADLAGSGMLHLDGLVDSADGLLPHLDRERRLAVLREPTAGAFGVGAAVVVGLLRLAALASIRPAPLLLGGLWCGSRTAMALSARLLPYARPGGLASAFLGSGVGRRGAVVVAGVGGVLGFGMLLDWRIGPGIAAGVAELVGVSLVLALARRRIGGFTGDVLGAAGLVGETAGLLVAAGRW